MCLRPRKVDNRRNGCGNNNPQQLVPVEERNTNKRWRDGIIKGWPQQGDEGNNQEQKEPGAASSLRTGNHDDSPFVTSPCRNDTTRERQKDGTTIW